MRSKANYLVASVVAYSLVLLTGLIPGASSPWTLPAFIEAAVMIGITILGIAKAYEAAGGEQNSSFIEEFICLQVPVLITTSLAVWSVFWILVSFFPSLITGVLRASPSFMDTLATFGMTLSGFLTFVFLVIAEVVFYLRLTRAMAAMRIRKSQVT